MNHPAYSPRPQSTRVVWLGLCLCLLFGSAGAQTLTFTIENVVLSGSAGNRTLTFDVLIAADQAGTHLGDTQVYLNYNPVGFGANVAGNGKATVTKGTLLASSDYANPILADNTTSKLSIYTDFSPGAGGSVEVPTTPAQLLQVGLAVADEAETAGLSFDQALMTNQQFEDDQATTYSVVATDTDDSALPVELIRFDAIADGLTVTLQWATASEVNNAGFFVERRRGETFEQLGFVDGAGTTAEGQQYQYQVKAPPPGPNAFRLKQVDFDGTFAYSPVVEVMVELPDRFMLQPAYPNPFNPEATVRFAVREAVPVQLALFDGLGRLVQVLYDAQPAAHQVQTVRLNGSGLASGMYVLRLSGPGINAAQTVMLVR